MPVTQTILNTIQSYLVGTNLYQIVEIGAVKDWSPYNAVCEVMFTEDDSDHWKLGGTIRDQQGFRVISAFNFTKQAPPVVVSQLITVRDTIVPLFQQHAYLGGVAGVQGSRVKPGSMKISWMLVNGDDYLAHEFVVQVHQVYSVPIGAQGI